MSQKRLVLVAWLTAVALLAVSLVPGVAPSVASRMPGNGDGAFPQRVGFIRDAPALPDKPGPLALVIDDNNFGNGAQEAIGADGRAWRLPTTVGPVLAPDGRRMAMLIDRKVELRDLVAGTTQSWPAPGDPQRSNGSIRELLSFSEDEAELLAAVEGRTHGWAALIDLSSGDLVRSQVNAHPIGLTDNGDVVTLRASDDALTVVVLDHALSEVRRFRLTPTNGWTSEPRERGTLTPAGELLVLDGDRDRLILRRFSLEDGIETSQVVADLDGRNVGSCCSLAWLGDAPVIVAQTTGSQARARQVHADGSTNQLGAIPRA